MSVDLLTRITNLMPEMSKGQRAISSYILENYDKAAFMTATKLGEKIGVSESTVVRFASFLGCDGYPQLQNEMQDLVRNKLTAVQRMKVTDNRMGDGDIIESVLNSDIEKIRKTCEKISREDFKRAVDLLISAKKIYILGIRSSASLASFVASYFRLIFDNVIWVQNTNESEMFEQLLRIGKDDVVLAISFPRYSQRIIKGVEYAHSQSANVVVLTDSSSSPIAPYASALLTAKSDMASFADSLVAPLSTINALIVAIAKEKHFEIESMLTKLKSVCDEYDGYDKDSEK